MQIKKECDQTCAAIACPGHIRLIKWRGPAEGELPANRYEKVSSCIFKRSITLQVILYRENVAKV